MAATNNVPVTLETPIVVKVLFRGQYKKFKLPLKDLGAHVLPEKLRSILQLQPEDNVVFERYSDSAAAYVTLDADKPQVYKTLFRAAKAKLKLRLRATIPGEEPPAAPPAAIPPHLVPGYVPSMHRMSTDTLIPQANATVSPVIARSPDAKPSPPLSPVSPPKATEAKAEEEAPIPQAFTARQSFFRGLATANHHSGLAFRPKPSNACTSWVVYCNNCNEPMEDEHFHCSVCDGGDYDLCPACVDNGIHCPGNSHWMVKRFVKNGTVVNSTTQRIAPKVKAEEEQEVPGAFTDEKQSVTLEEEPTRTCNCCVKVLPEKDFVTCVSCEDYDLCLECHVNNKHGHHPAHTFKAATPETVLPTLAEFLCNSGRNVRHSAICDGCDKFIYGVRHKCLNCPDWDYCSDCVKNAKFIHPRHRFVPIYEPLAEPLASANRHYGIYCDGPLCKEKENVSYIEGVRYKCAVCHDTDFCQNCEAHPSNKHNHTHPLIKFQTSVRSVSVTTVNDDKQGRCMARLGDRQVDRRSTATETTPVASSTNAATQVQTIVDMKPSEVPQVKKEKITISDLLVESVEPVQEVVTAKPSEAVKTEAIAVPKSAVSLEGLDAHFIRDTIVDGSKICMGAQFVQTWTLRNPGPNAWPKGCSVRHVGGDNMLNIDNTRPLSKTDLAEASESNILTHAVEAGEEFQFRVMMKAPQREGTAISYWRLKTPAGLPFGHRLWCDIAVVAPRSPPVATPASGSATTYEVAPKSNPLYERLLQARAERMKHVQHTQQQQLEHLNQLQLKHNQLTQQRDQEKMERIQRIRKAAVERVLENRRKEHEAALATIKQEPVPSPKAEVAPEEPAAELPVEIEEKPAQPAAEPVASGMIFPQLDKESPESSTYEAPSTVQPMSPESQKSTIARTITVASDDEFFEDAESVALHSDDGFMTDEEYDILDASDEEMP
ncbi:zz type zinc finger domain-containing protein [Pyrenophora tritici-repentis]|nr:zz type zinc finger domain-containing protein [Pyrenophora tritici-repentis]